MKAKLIVLAVAAWMIQIVLLLGLVYVAVKIARAAWGA